MPTKISFYRKETGEYRRLPELDREICDHFGYPCDPDLWAHNWMDVIGFAIAIGWNLEDQCMVDLVKDLPELEKIRAYMAEHYTTDAHRVFN